MGLLDGMLGKAGFGGPGGGLLGQLGGMLGGMQGGGIATIIQEFEAKGLGPIVQSWISTGPNLPITPEQITHGLGAERMQQISKMLGMSPDDLSAKLSQFLPGLVDSLTPDGKLPEGPIKMPGM